MTRRLIPLTAIALTAAAALTLSACGSDDDSGNSGKKDNDKIAGADTGSDTSASASPSRSAAAGRPEIDLPSDAKNVFEDQKTGDATKDAVLADAALSVDSIDEAIFEGSTGTEALSFYNTGKALSSSITYVKQYIDGNDTWVGETRYFDHKVTLRGEDKAYVTYCSDESKSYIKSKKTGKVDRDPATKDSYVLYHTALTRNGAGVWQTNDIASERGAEECQP
ncbi:hypothetical protein ABZ397_20445 [Streptomyces sp. NPDC005876]|uniref:hypothetical protein n=1 Tax=Streptomyces sp. NPDC005876 TaxID=3157076 RepID=UPI0034053FA7